MFLHQAEVKAMTQDHCWLPGRPRARKPLPEVASAGLECWVEKGLGQGQRPGLYQCGWINQVSVPGWAVISLEN